MLGAVRSTSEDVIYGALLETSALCNDLGSILETPTSRGGRTVEASQRPLDIDHADGPKEWPFSELPQVCSQAVLQGEAELAVRSFSSEATYILSSVQQHSSSVERVDTGEGLFPNSWKWLATSSTAPCSSAGGAAKSLRQQVELQACQVAQVIPQSTSMVVASSNCSELGQCASVPGMAHAEVAKLFRGDLVQSLPILSNQQPRPAALCVVPAPDQAPTTLGPPTPARPPLPLSLSPPARGPSPPSSPLSGGAAQRADRLTVSELVSRLKGSIAAKAAVGATTPFRPMQFPSDAGDAAAGRSLGVEGSLLAGSGAGLLKRKASAISAETISGPQDRRQSGALSSAALSSENLSTPEWERKPAAEQKLAPPKSPSSDPVLDRSASIASSGASGGHKHEPGRWRREERQRKIGEAKGRATGPCSDGLQEVAALRRRVEELEKENRSLLLQRSFMHRKDSEQTTRIEGLEQQVAELLAQQEWLRQAACVHQYHAP